MPLYPICLTVADSNFMRNSFINLTKEYRNLIIVLLLSSVHQIDQIQNYAA